VKDRDKNEPDEVGSYKGMGDIYAVDSMLYVSVYHKGSHGTNGQCGAGIRGASYLFQYCLPFGKCAFDTTSPGKVNQVKIGVGILGTGMGQSFNNQADQISLVISKDNENDCDRPENKHAPQCQSFDNSVRLKQLRWYETR
jgi:type IV pilus assembly protein PilY1